MKRTKDDRSRSIAHLIGNVKTQDFLPDEGNPAYALIKSRKTYMPAYVPYVGSGYFGHRPRILCYAINQNLSRHRSWSDAWMREWALDQMCAVDRLNHAVKLGRALPIKPYAEGFIPLTAILCLLAYDKRRADKLPRTIDDVIAVTNFVKFSTAESASSSDIPDSWWKECGSRYVAHEIDVLKPDVVVAFGRKTFLELSRVVSSMHYGKGPVPIWECRFPGRIPSEKARPVNGDDRHHWMQDILPLTRNIRVPRESFAAWRMERFPGYFLDIAKALEIV